VWELCYTVSNRLYGQSSAHLHTHLSNIYIKCVCSRSQHLKTRKIISPKHIIPCFPNDGVKNSMSQFYFLKKCDSCKKVTQGSILLTHNLYSTLPCMLTFRLVGFTNKQNYLYCSQNGIFTDIMT